MILRLLLSIQMICEIFKNTEEYNTDQESKILIVFEDMIADMINSKKRNSIITELFIRGRKLNIFLVFITQSYFKVPKDVRLISTHFFIMKTSTNCAKSFIRH